jgi:hypothetical protein
VSTIFDTCGKLFIGGKFASGVSDASGKFIEGVNKTSGG